MANDVKHIHPVPDDDPHFKIDPETRQITYESAEKLLLIQGDHNSERYSFELPREIDGHDMTKCNLVQVHFINIFGNDPSRTSAGVYEVNDLQLDPDDDQLVRLSWLISQVATKHVGTLSFMIRFKCTTPIKETVENEDGTSATIDTLRVDYSWGTFIFGGIVISTGIDNSDVVVEQNYDVLEEWYAKLMSAGNTGSTMVDAAVEEGIEKLNVAVQTATDSARQDIDDHADEKKKQLTIDTLKLDNIIVQETGRSTQKVMSQDAVTGSLDMMEAYFTSNNEETLAKVNERITEMTDKVASLATREEIPIDIDIGYWLIIENIEGYHFHIKSNSTTNVEIVLRVGYYYVDKNGGQNTTDVNCTINVADEVGIAASYTFIPISYSYKNPTSGESYIHLSFLLNGQRFVRTIDMLPDGAYEGDVVVKIVNMAIKNAEKVYRSSDEVSNFTVTANGITDIEFSETHDGGSSTLWNYHYTLIFDNGEKRHFTLPHPAIIRDIKKVSSAGAVDTYEIEVYPTDTDGGTQKYYFTVTNGAGPYIVFSEYENGYDDNDSSSFTSVWTSGMNYMGIATGPEAPIDPDSYTWVRIADMVNITQTTGESEALAASQKLVTDLTNAIHALIEAHEKEIESLKSEASRANKRLTNIEDNISGDLIVTDSTVAMVKDVPENTSSFAEVVEIGGLTRKCTNLLPFPYQSGAGEKNGITWTVNADQTVTANGTATEDSTFTCGYFMLTAYESYYYTGCPRGGSETTYFVRASGFGNDVGGGIGISCPYDFQSTQVLTIKSGYTANNLVFKPMVSKGTTALPYEPYFEGLRSAPVTEVVSEGVNLTTAQAVYKDAVTYQEMVVDNRNCIRMTSGKTIACTPFAFKENTQYTVSFYTKSENFGGATGGNIVFTFFYTDGTNSDVRSSHLSTDWHLITLTSEAGKTVKKIGVFIAQYQVYNYIDVDTFMFNKGATALPYRPYIKRTLPVIPKIKSHDTWGICLGDIRDSIDWVNLKYTQRVGVVDLGTLNWEYVGSGMFRAPASELGFKYGLNGDCSKYTLTSSKGVNKTIYIFDTYYATGTMDRIVITDTAYTDATTFKAAMSGVMLYYELTEPVISALPSELEVLKDYGVGIPDTDYFNRIRWRYDEATDKWVREYYRPMKTVDMGTLTWQHKVLSGDRHTFYTSSLTDLKINEDSSVPINAICAPYRAVATNATWVSGDMGYDVINKNILDIVDNNYTDATSFKSAMSGVILCYALTTPEITDISDLLPEDNLIGVEGGGSITMQNEYGYDLPNTVRYQLKKTEVTE